MDPVFSRINPVAAGMYGMSLMLALVVGYIIVRHEARRCKADPDRYNDLCFYALIAAIAGSRLFYVLVDPDVLKYDRLAVFKFWQGGLLFYGGFIGALTTAVLYLPRKGLPVANTLDILTPGIVMGQVIGQIGCLASGCMYGRPCDDFWAVTYRNPDTMAIWGVPLHPTQLYAACLSLVVFLIVWQRRFKKRFDGELFWRYVLLDGGSRMLVDHFRGDYRGKLIGDLWSVSQVIAGILILLAAVMLFRKQPKKPLR